jgi:lambda family phage portal protein
MKYEVRTPRKTIEVNLEDNFLERAIKFVDPNLYAKRLRGRIAGAIAGNYFGASKSRRQLSQWNPKDGSPDVTVSYELQDLRSRSRDLLRNAPLATGAINTVCTNVVGSGLQLQSRIDRSILNITDEQATAWENKAELEWSLFWDTKEVDLSRTLTGSGLMDLVFRQVLENGDVFVNLPRMTRGNTPYLTRLQLIEADRVCNKDSVSDTNELVMGIEKDEYGAPKAYHICNEYPYYNLISAKGIGRKWTVIPAYSEKTGLPNMLHVFRPLRPGQSRGLPYLTPVVEQLKQIDRYSEAELMAAVIASYMTVFIRTEKGNAEFDVSGLGVETGAKASDTDIKLASGAIIDLAKGESIEVFDPKRPNTSFDPFVQAVLRQIGVALEIPFEILIKHFTASYSAARAAILEAWKFFLSRRTWLAGNFVQPVYEVFLYEAISSGRLPAPGYFTNPLIRMAYNTAEWIGPAPGQIDPVKEVDAAIRRIDNALSTRAKETAALGGDWDSNIRQLEKERQQLDAAGLWPLAEGGEAPAPAGAPAPKDDENENKGGSDLETP